MIVEKNDIDISPLFSWSREFAINHDGEDVPVFIRILGDADLNRARVAALRAGADLRRKLKDLNSDERIVYIKNIDDMEIETLVNVILVFSIKELSEKAQKNSKIRPPKEPRSDAKMSAHEKYQEEIDSYPARKQAELKELLEKEVNANKEALYKETKEVLYMKYVQAMIDELCEQTHLRVFKSWCAYLGSYKNAELTERLFSSYDEFDNLDSDLKAQFITEYSKMELHGDDIKKLQRVTR